MIKLDLVKVLSGGLEAALFAVDRRPNHPHLVLDQRPLRCAAPCTSATRLLPRRREADQHVWLKQTTCLNVIERPSAQQVLDVDTLNLPHAVRAVLCGKAGNIASTRHQGQPFAKLHNGYRVQVHVLLVSNCEHTQTMEKVSYELDSGGQQAHTTVRTSWLWGARVCATYIDV
jgi:hypothetical protein